ncbi:MAG: hypothetical protein SGPRY_009088, partial [Prymnesium sp.]
DSKPPYNSLGLGYIRLPPSVLHLRLAAMMSYRQLSVMSNGMPHRVRARSEEHAAPAVPSQPAPPIHLHSTAPLHGITSHLSSFWHEFARLGTPVQGLIALAVFAAVALISLKLRDPSQRYRVVTLLYCALYLLVGPSAILFNKTLLKDVGFHYPVMVSSLGQTTTTVCAVLSVRVFKWTKLNNGPKGSTQLELHYCLPTSSF